MPDEKPRIDRRKFVTASLTSAGVGVAGYVGYRHWHKHRYIPGTQVIEDHPGLVLANAGVSARRRLGRTGLSISVIGIGAGGLKGPELIVRAVDKGMNYIDTAICYGDSEKVIARALHSSPGLRKKLIIATKWDATATDKKDDILESLNKSLKRLKTDVIDIMQIHWLGGGHVSPDTGINRLDNPELYLAMEEAKKSGKVRFFGATSHAGDRGKILEYAIDKGAFDMLLVKMNVLDYDGAGLPSLLAKAKQKDIGVVVMKSQPGGDRIPDGYEKSKYSIFQANLRWVLQHPEVTCVVHSKIGTDRDSQDLAIAAVSERLTLDDRALLDGYARALSPLYCRGCSEHCVSACPAGVAIPHVAQFDMYDRQYGWHDAAREHYRALPVAQRWSELCSGCDLCSQACPHGFDAAGVVRAAQRLA